MNTTKIHKFEAAGLGKAPFKYVGFEDTSEKAGPDGFVRVETDMGTFMTKPGGSCDYCGHYIVVFHYIRSADGKRSKVGCDCIEKVGDKGVIDLVKRANAKRAKTRKAASESTKITDGWDSIRQSLAALSQFPHPNAYMASKGLTFADYCEYMMEHGGNTGKLQMINKARKYLA